MSRTCRNIVRRFSLPVLFIALAGLLASGCTASNSTKRGGPGEFCNGSDQECRQGLICDRGVCAHPNRRHRACRSVCSRFETCGANLGGCSDRSSSGSLELCYQDCMKTLETWGREQVTSYQNCYLQNLSCSEIQSKQCPQNICYQRLDLPSTRAETCRSLREPIRTCYSAANAEPDDQLSNFADGCRQRARTASDRDWSTLEQCQSSFESSGNCSALFQCFNRELPLGDDEQFPISPPSNTPSPSPTPDVGPPRPDRADAGIGADASTSVPPRP